MKTPRKRNFNVEGKHEKEHQESVYPEKKEQNDDLLAEDEKADIQG